MQPLSSSLTAPRARLVHRLRASDRRRRKVARFQRRRIIDGEDICFVAKTSTTIKGDSARRKQLGHLVGSARERSGRRFLIASASSSSSSSEGGGGGDEEEEEKKTKKEEDVRSPIPPPLPPLPPIREQGKKNATTAKVKTKEEEEETKTRSVYIQSSS